MRLLANLNITIVGDQRRAQRRRTLQRAHVVGDVEPSVEVAVLNLSPDGAELLVNASAAILGRFALFVDAQKVSLDCRLRWRKGNRAGVQILRPRSLTESLK